MVLIASALGGAPVAVNVTPYPAPTVTPTSPTPNPTTNPTTPNLASFTWAEND